MRVGRDHGRAVGAARAQVDRIVLGPLAERRAGELAAADRVLLVGERRVDPTSRSACGCGARRGRCRRASTPAARRADPHVPAHLRRVGASRLFVPSLNPCRLRGVAWPSDVDDARPKPSCVQRITAAPRPIRARSRTAWNATCGIVGAGLHAQVAAASSPRSSWSPGQRPERRERARPPGGEPEAVLPVLHEDATGRARR